MAFGLKGGTLLRYQQMKQQLSFCRQKANVRAERDDKLRETDYLGLSDATMSTETATYRQALRDVLHKAAFLIINWPTKP